METHSNKETLKKEWRMTEEKMDELMELMEEKKKMRIRENLSTKYENVTQEMVDFEYEWEMTKSSLVVKDDETIDKVAPHLFAMLWSIRNSQKMLESQDPIEATQEYRYLLETYDDWKVLYSMKYCWDKPLTVPTRKSLIRNGITDKKAIKENIEGYKGLIKEGKTEYDLALDALEWSVTEKVSNLPEDFVRYHREDLDKMKEYLSRLRTMDQNLEKELNRLIAFYRRRFHSYDE